jgi:hypothetical protein
MTRRNDSFRLHCRTCGQGFLEMLELLKHRDRCGDDAQNPAGSHKRGTGQPSPRTEQQRSSPKGRGAR